MKLIIYNEVIELSCYWQNNMNIENIWHEYRSSLHAFLTSRLSNPADVEDLLQEILITSHNNLDKINAEESIKPWLFRVAKNALIDFYRKRGHIQGISEEELLQEEEASQVTHDISECLLPFIQELPEENAQLLLDIDIHNESQKEYAKKLDISYSTLKSRVQKSRQMLKGIYDNCCDFDVDLNGKVIDYQRTTETKKHP